jgi:hypothetical protein
MTKSASLPGEVLVVGKGKGREWRMANDDEAIARVRNRMELEGIAPSMPR